jgi:hypothetical protein
VTPHPAQDVDPGAALQVEPVEQPVGVWFVTGFLLVYILLFLSPVF